MILRIKPQIDRPYWNFRNNSPTPEEVGNYLKELKQSQKKIKDLSWDIKDFISEDWVNGIQEAIKDEISYCEFYFELKKRRKDENFKKWVFKTESGRSWYENGDRWECFNGKIKLIIKIKKEPLSTHIELRIDNDSKFLHFLPDGRMQEISTKVLRSEKSINEYIEQLKSGVEDYFERYSKPNYNREEMEYKILNILLGEENDY